MKLSKILNFLSNLFRHKKKVTKESHTAYSEQVVREDGSYLIRVYDYEQGKVLDEVEGKGDKKAAYKHAKKCLKEYKRK